jgi:hypothetical protein
VVARLTCPSGGTGPKIGVIPDAGPGYIFNPNGSSCYGKDPSNGHDIALATDFSVSAGSGKYDTPAIPAVGYPSFGTFDNGATTTLFAPAAGLLRALDLVINEYQGGQDFIAAWNPSSGQFTSGFPTPDNDLAFLSGQVVGDILGTPKTQEVIAGTASLDLAAVNSSGAPANSHWPKLTGDWTIATPVLGSFGTLDTQSSARKDIVSITRMGTLSVYGTPATACSPSSWPNFHHDIANSGDYSRDAVPPGAPMDARVSGSTLAFVAPGNDLLCGTASAYQVATSSHRITPQNFAAARQLRGLPAPHGAGTHEAINLPGAMLRYIAVRAVDRQGNLGLPAVVDTAAPGANGRCVSRRLFTIHLHAPRGQRLASARVYVNGHRVRILRGRRLHAPVNLRGLPRGRFSVKIVMRTTSGRRLTRVRHYRTCTPKRVHRRAPKRRHRRRG